MLRQHEHLIRLSIPLQWLSLPMAIGLIFHSHLKQPCYVKHIFNHCRSPGGPLDLASGLEPKKQLLLSVMLNSSFIQSFGGIMPNHGSGELSGRQGFYAYEMMQSAAVFSLSGHITIRVIPIIKDLDRWGKTVRSCYKIII